MRVRNRNCPGSKNVDIILRDGLRQNVSFRLSFINPIKRSFDVIAHADTRYTKLYVSVVYFSRRSDESSIEK